METKKGPVFSEALLRYTEEHLISPDSFDRFKEPCVAWIPAKLFENIPGNQINTLKLERLRETLSETKPFDVLNKEGCKTRLPILSIDCYTGNIRLQEGNHRVYILINDLKAESIPVEIVFLEIYSEEEEDKDDFVEDFHTTLLERLEEQHLNTNHRWYRKEVWRACAYFVVKEYILKE
jgi:hypothetical protein